MKSYVIRMSTHPISEKGALKVIQSSKDVSNDFVIYPFEACHENNSTQYMKDFGLKWTWPWEGSVWNEETKIQMRAYATKVKERRIGCAMSHFRLWKLCEMINEPILILEHDAIFIKKLDYKYIIDSEYEVVGINDPRGATRLSEKYHSIVQSSEGPLLDVPTIDDMKIAQGIAGASAYIVKPKGCQQIINAAYKYGLWPNDALICQQLFNFIGQTKEYYTIIQKLHSTTTK